MNTITITSKEYADLYGCSQRYVNNQANKSKPLKYVYSVRQSGATWLLEVDKNWYDSKNNPFQIWNFKRNHLHLDILKQNKIMKITRRGKEIDLPKYFKSGRCSFMLADNDRFVKVMEDSWEYGFNYIRCEHIQFLQYEDIETIEHISETEFKNSFIRVSLEIEKLMN